MIGSNSELYDNVSELAGTLDAGGEQLLAAALRDAMAISSLPGEVLGEIRVHLHRVQDSPMYRRLDVRSRVDESVRYIDTVLGNG